MWNNLHVKVEPYYKKVMKKKEKLEKIYILQYLQADGRINLHASLVLSKKTRAPRTVERESDFRHVDMVWDMG